MVQSVGMNFRADHGKSCKIASPHISYALIVEKIADTIRKLLSQTSDVTRPMEYFLATGNNVSKAGLGLMQVSSFKYNFFLTGDTLSLYIFCFRLLDLQLWQTN